MVAHGASRFPDIKELKQIVRDQVAPERDLGHSDAKPASLDAAASGRSPLARLHDGLSLCRIEKETKEMAEPVVVTIPHKLGKEEAARRLKNGFGGVR